MGTRFKGTPNGFNKSGSNDVTPNFMGSPSTKFKGRGGLPEGALKRYPGGAADIEGSNRRHAKVMHGDGMGSGVDFRTQTAFGNKRSGGPRARTYNTGGGIGSGFRKGSKSP